LLILAAPVLAAVAHAAGLPFANDPSVTQRLAAWEASLKLLAGRPLLGLGPDNFAVGYKSVETLEGVLASFGETFNSTHNWFLYFATSAGIVGACAALAVVAMVGIAGWRLARSGDVAALAVVPFAAYLGQGIVDVNDISLDWVFWAAAGAIAATAPRALWSLPKPSRGPVWSAGTAVCLTVLALVAAAPSFGRITASETFKTSLLYAQEGNAPLAIEAARISIALDPRRAEYWNAFGSALAVSGNASAAATAFADAAARAPWEAGYQRNIALQKVRTGDFTGAQAAIQRSLALDPFDADSLDIEARFTFNRGDFEGAARLGELAVRLRPVDVPKYEVPAQAYFQLKRYDDAEKLLKSGLSKVDDPHLHVLLALTYIGEGKRDAALQELDRALALAPANPEALAIRQQLTGK
jgi:Tfp pilus assembly protein PilF